MKRLRCILQPHRPEKKNRISRETIILLPNVQIFANNCHGPAGLKECFILFFWPSFWQRASLKSVRHSAVYSSLIHASPLCRSEQLVPARHCVGSHGWGDAAPWGALGLVLLLICITGGQVGHQEGKWKTDRLPRLLLLRWCSLYVLIIVKETQRMLTYTRKWPVFLRWTQLQQKTTINCAA